MCKVTKTARPRFLLGLRKRTFLIIKLDHQLIYNDSTQFKTLYKFFLVTNQVGENNPATLLRSGWWKIAKPGWWHELPKEW